MPATENDYILEFIPNGRFVKVTAIDPETGLEAVLVGSRRDSRELLTREAVRKLEYILQKQSIK